MPGRFSITADKKTLGERYLADVPEDYNPRYNASPTQKIPVILNESPQKIVMARWGVKSRWFPHPIINARSENIEKNRVFSNAFKERRCLILADSYYEWDDTPEGKIPYRIMLKDRSIFSIAGIWEDIGGERYVATITVAPNRLVGKIHERMPAILRKDDEDRWLNFDDKTLLRSYDEKEMMLYRVSTEVNSSRHDKREYVEPVGKIIYS